MWIEADDTIHFARVEFSPNTAPELSAPLKLFKMDPRRFTVRHPLSVDKVRIPARLREPERENLASPPH